MSNELIDQARNVPITEYLLLRGYKPVPRGDRGKYVRYMSMLHTENVPSFFVDKNKNRWKDFGMSNTRWLDVIELARILEGIGFMEAVHTLVNKKLVPFKEIPQEEIKPGIEVVNERALIDERLIEYLTIDRGIDLDLARYYCRQVQIRFPNGKYPDKIHTYIGFRNDKGGFELRNHYRGAVGKVSTSPKYFTRINGEPDKYNLFEGFIDFLTLLMQYNTQKFKNTTVVLNSLVNFNYLYETLKTNDENNLFIDNDEAADKYIFKGDKKMKIKSLKERGIIYNDCRGIFKQANDINDYENGKLYI